MIYVVSAILFLHIISLPIVTEIVAFADTDENFGRLTVRISGITVVNKRFDITRIIERAADKKSSDEKNEEKDTDNKSVKKSGTKKFLLFLVKNLILRIRIRRMKVNAKIGTGDAATAAVSCGILRITYLQVCSIMGFDGSPAEFVPIYDGERLFFDINGIFSLCIADIIYAVSTALVQSIGNNSKKIRRDHASAVTE